MQIYAKLLFSNDMQELHMFAVLLDYVVYQRGLAPTKHIVVLTALF